MNQPDDTGLRAAASRAAEQARQPEPVALDEDAVHGRCSGFVRLFIWKHKRDPYPQEIWDAALVLAQPPADLKDAQRYRHLRDTMFMYDAINLLRAFSTQKWDMQIDADIRARAMLSSAPTGEKP